MAVGRRAVDLLTVDLLAVDLARGAAADQSVRAGRIGRPSYWFSRSLSAPAAGAAPFRGKKTRDRWSLRSVPVFARA
ncbi:hypothetical protein [Streptomyces exfoliatus]|uniref:hypothetical protein n=1 Tax=Streptomyces exfoliatus TaxID=1905 RepID=UPI0004C68A0D|nr:hypothetical protein [Streptomyces exfoliatus]